MNITLDIENLVAEFRNGTRNKVSLGDLDVYLRSLNLHKLVSSSEYQNIYSTFVDYYRASIRSEA